MLLTLVTDQAFSIPYQEVDHTKQQQQKYRNFEKMTYHEVAELTSIITASKVTGPEVAKATVINWEMKSRVF